MRFFLCLLALVTAVAAGATLQAPEITSAPVVERRDLYSDVNDFTSVIAGVPSGMSALYSLAYEGMSSSMVILSSEYANLTASAGSVTSSLGLQLSTADAAASSSINSQLSQVAANVSSASAALETARSVLTARPTTSSTSTSTSTAGVGCARTAAVGIGALAGGMAILAHL
ncbi:hypothetical protein Daus18300_011661 [Diaporthe australafricana]|uniref:Uncharacterized protein n=1 Tax=Diaporthe australafricana TaxID=127596 RepID=A0ABR3W5U3_9PEZI